MHKQRLPANLRMTERDVKSTGNTLLLTKLVTTVPSRFGGCRGVFQDRSLTNPRHTEHAVATACGIRWASPLEGFSAPASTHGEHFLPGIADKGSGE